MYIEFPPDYRCVATWKTTRTGVASVFLFKTKKEYRGIGIYCSQLLPATIDSDEAAIAEIERLISIGVYQEPMKRLIKGKA